MLRCLVTILPINRTTLTNRYIHYLAPATTIYHRYLSIVEKPFVSAKFVDALHCLDRAYSLNLWADDLFPSLFPTYFHLSPRCNEYVPRYQTKTYLNEIQGEIKIEMHFTLGFTFVCSNTFL